MDRHEDLSSKQQEESVRLDTFRLLLQPTKLKISHKVKNCYNLLTLCLTLSRESGVSTENPINITWALEYAKGLNLS
jgi:hypothetical protein